jgi:predicted outer membrane repeat protein
VTAAAAGLTTIDFSLTNTPPVNFVVTTHLDDTGSAGNCTQQTTPGTGTDSSCSLRDALLAAETVGAVNISFSSADFNAANTTALNTITLTNGTLVIPTNTTISGPTTGSGATLTNLVTVDGNGSVIDFTVPNGVNAEIDNLIITGGHSLLYGGGISIQGALKLNSCTFTGNTANQGGAIYNQGTVTVTNSTFTGNSADSLGGGIEIDLGSATVTGSTFSGNSSMHGGGIDIGDGSMTVINSTFSGNLANAGGEGGGGIYNCGGGTLTLLNSSFAENSNGGLVNCQPLTMYNTAFADDFYNNASSYTGSGNATSSVLFSPLANYGGPTQTMIPLADTSAICAGIASPTGLILPTTDQRGAGFPRVNTTYPGYSNATPCVDAGSVQSNYTMAFTTEPPATVAGNVPFTAANAPQVTLSEEGNMAAFANSGTVTASGAPATVGGTTSETFSAGVGAFTGLTITAASSSETLTATLNLNPNIPTLNLTAVSSIFAVTALTFSSTTLTSGMAGQSYSTQVPAVTGGSGSYSYALTTGSQLPTGLTLSGSGLITGTPTAASVTPYTFSITATDTVSTATANASFSLTINQGTPYLTWTQPTAITYETSLSGVLNAALQPAWSSVTGNITYTATPSGGVATTVTTATILNAGSYTLKAIFTPGDTADYLTETASVSLSVNQAMPVITWPAPAAITYGTALSGTQLDATASFNGSPVTGNYTYSPLAGTKLSAGASQTLSVTFVPGDTTNFATPPTATTTITVNQAMPVITWPAPAAITYGTPLSGTQLDATASFNGSPVSGNYTYSPLAGTKLGAGANQTLSVTFVPGDTTNFATPPVATTTITVNQAMPIITWPAPAAITYGTALSGTQLDATASFNGSPVTGTFTYLPLAGTKLNGGATQTLSVTFVPGDTTNFATPPAATTTITVNQVQSSILLASSANPVFVQNPISFTATVGDSLGALAAGPTGTVTFESNGAPIATCTGIALSANNLATGSATASCTITPSSVATNTITAIYNGDVNFLTSNSSPLPEAIVNFAFNMQNTTLKVIPGASAQYTFTVTPLDGVTVFPGPITLSVSNLPPGATWSFSSTNAQFSPSTNTIALGAGATTVTLTIQTAQIASVAQPGAGGNLAAQPDAFKLAPFTLALLLLPFVNRLRRAGKRFRRALPLLLLLGLSLVVAAGLGGCGSPDGFFGQAQRNYTVTVTGSSHELSNTTSVTLMVE